MQKIYLSLLLLFIGAFITGCTSENAGIELLDTQISETGQVTDDAPESETVVVSGESAVSSFDGQEAEQVLQSEEKSIFVYVCGAVLSPGVYELKDGSRVTDAVDAAGGFSGDADRTYVNLAALLTDGVKLLIPTVEETAGAEPASGIETFDTGGSADTAEEKLININSATRQELTALPGIGDATADRIVKYREEYGGFKAIEDIMKVSGIKDKLFSRIREYITV